MARRYATVDNIISALVADMIDTGLYSAKSIAHVKEHCYLIVPYLDKSLYDMGPEDVRAIHSRLVDKGLAIATQKSYMQTIRALLKFIHNPAYDTRILYQADTRPRVDWLTYEQAQAVLSAPLSSIQHLAVVLGLCMGLRRVEMVRLRMSDIDIHNGYVNVTGKGRAGGKLRLVPFHARFIPALNAWLKDRAQIVAKSYTAPDNVLIWYDREHHTAEAYNAIKGSGIDGLIRRASKLIGVHFSAHTLRRTFGRLLWLAGIPVVTISKIMGHSSTEQTLSYIGANLDDMAHALDKLVL